MHFQDSVPNWPDALVRMPDRHLFKAVANPGLITEAVRKWTEAGRDPRLLLTDYRHYDLYLPHGDWESVKAQWRAMFFRFVNRTYLEQHAANVKMVEENNEYFTTDSIQNPGELAAYLLSVRAAVAVWNGEFRGRVVHSPDGGVGTIPPDCRLVIANSFVANDIPREYFQLALSDDCVLAYHAYSKYENGERWPDDWPNHSGRWERMEQQFGLKPIWAFTETGPYFDSGAGWRDPKCLGNDENKLVVAMRQFYTDLAATAAYREGRLLGAAWFTCVASGWRGYYLETPQLTLIADEARAMWRPGVLDPPAPPAPLQEIVLDISHHQPATSDLATAKAAGATGIIIRSCYGTQADSVAPLHIAHADAAGLPRGFYWYHLSRQHAQDQAALAFQVAGSRTGMQGFADLEESTANDGAEPVFPRFSELYYNHINAALLKCDALTLHNTGIYSRKGWLDWWFTLEQQRRWNFRPLWVASWTDGQPSLPVGWSALAQPYVLHQFKVTETWPGFTVRVDRNKTYPGLQAVDILGGAVVPPQTGALTMAEKQEIEKHLDAVWVILWPKVKAKNPCGLYDAPNGALLRTLTDGRTMDVFSKAGPWLLVTAAPNPIYWVRQQDVIQP